MTALEDEAREFFTDDAVFLDPAWGRSQGKADMSAFLNNSMAGLEDWTFPEQWTIVSGNRVVSLFYNRLPGQFFYDLDILNMAEVGELIAESGWVPPATMKRPPKSPVRDTTPADGMTSP